MKKRLLFTIIASLAAIAFLHAQVAPTVFAQDFTMGLIGINIDAQGNIWATEHGTGNDDGRITIIDPAGNKTVFMTGLPSTFIQAAGEIVGSYRTYQRPDNKVLIVVGEGSHDLSETLLVVDKADFTPGTPLTLDDVELVIDHGAFIHGLGFVQSNPFNVEWDAEGNMFIADSGANSIVKWDAATGDFSIVKTLDRFPNPLPFGPPMVDPVPTKALRKPDGTFYVSQLTGFPFLQGAAKVHNLDTAGNLSVHAEGFTCLTDMHFDPTDGNLCVMQFGVFGDVGGTLNFMLGSAAVIKLMPDGSRDTIAQGIGGLAPSFTFDGDGNLYVVDIVFGQVLKYNLLSSTQETLLSSAAVKVFPNPASEQVNIEYELTREAPVTMGIYDLGGRLLASWNEGNMPSGKHLLTWNGTDAGGRTIQNGTYIFRLLAGNSLSAGLISWQKP
jgi:sugar lactone lactonase YvrE